MTRTPASATCRWIAGEPITNAVRRRPPSVPPSPSAFAVASMNWIDAPTVTTSSSEALRPSDHSLRTYSSGASAESFVMKLTVIPAARSSASASPAPGVSSSDTQTQPSRSSSTCSYARMKVERGMARWAQAGLRPIITSGHDPPI